MAGPPTSDTTKENADLWNIIVSGSQIGSKNTKPPTSHISMADHVTQHVSAVAGNLTPKNIIPMNHEN